MKEDPTRDPASEARDDHASEPRATPETDYAAWGETDVVEAAFARRLERQRDELMEALGLCLSESYNGPMPDYAREKASSAIASVKEGKP